MPGQVAAAPAIVRHYHYHRGGRDKSSGMVAALLSFLIPGLGQLCQGRVGTGAILFAAVVLAVVIGIAFVPFLAVALLLWLWAIVDAAWGG